jgi:hypothetical protein
VEKSSPPVPAEVSDEIKKLHADFVAEVHKREVSSSENFDKSVLTFSSAGLALSIGFLKDFVPIQIATAPWTLYGSWILFTLATCATMGSFLASSQALAVQKELAYTYYIERDDGAFTRANPWDRRTRTLNYVSGGAFLLAMVLSVAFISINLKRGSLMKQTTSQTQIEILQKGLTVPTMQQVPPTAAQPAASQPAPAQPTTSATTAK